MNVRFLELGPTYAELRQEFDAAYQRVMDSGWYLLGSELEAFEAEYAVFCGSDYCVGVGSGLDALQLSLLALGIGPGDDVIVPSHTFIATWLAVTHTGATPIPVEPDPGTMNIDTDRIEAAISSRTRAIVPVHLYGQTADMTAICEIAERHGLYVIEDAAQSAGAMWEGKRAGSLGNLAAHSFYPGKNLGAFGDGGAVTTNDPDLADRVRMLRNYGSQQKYHHDLPGFNSRMDELQAAFLRIKLQHLDAWNHRRKQLAMIYREQLAPLAICHTAFRIPEVLDRADPVWHLFVVRHPRRDQLQAALAQAGVGTLIHYPIPVHRSTVYRSQIAATFPIAEEIASQALSLPIGPHLDSDAIRFVCQLIRSFLSLES
jgi:dTDP-4-amino-4,6-dideoxygalactose transaminase